MPTEKFQSMYETNVLSYLSQDWGEVGFQSHDPTTDLRAMGLLGLIQLVYFSENYNSNAAAILFDSQHPRRYYPFAATGINITYFVVTMFQERRLDQVIFSASKGIDDNESESLLPKYEEPRHLNCAIGVLHELYCSVFKDFSMLWISRDPENIMAFKAIFDEVKSRYHVRYPALEA